MCWNRGIRELVGSKIVTLNLVCQIYYVINLKPYWQFHVDRVSSKPQVELWAVLKKIYTDLILKQIVVGTIAGMQVCEVPSQVCQDNQLFSVQILKTHRNIVTYTLSSAARSFFIPFLVAWTSHWEHDGGSLHCWLSMLRFQVLVTLRMACGSMPFTSAGACKQNIDRQFSEHMVSFKIQCQGNSFQPSKESSTLTSGPWF